MSAAVSVEGLSVRLGEVRALDGVDLRLPAGRVTGLVGVNGAGKSTLLKALLGMVPVERGRVLVDGGPPAAARRAGAIAYVPQSEDVDWTFPVSVRDVVEMGRPPRLVGRRGAAPRRGEVAAALERVDLTELADRQIGRLSGGQRKRVFVARGLVQRARVLLLDEPFAGVDARSAELIGRVLRERAAAGATVLVSTHDLPALPELADAVVLLRRTVLFHGAVAEALRPARLGAALGLPPTGGTDGRGPR